MSFPSSAQKTEGSQYSHTPVQAQKHQHVMHSVSMDPFGQYNIDPTQASLADSQRVVKSVSHSDAVFDSNTPWGKKSLTPAERRSGVQAPDMRAPAKVAVGPTAATAAAGAPPAIERNVAAPTAPAPASMPAMGGGGGAMSEEPNRSAFDNAATGVSGFLPASSIDVPAVPWFHGPAARLQANADAAAAAAAAASAPKQTASEAELPILPDDANRGVVASMNSPHGKFYRAPDLSAVKRPDGRSMSEDEETMAKRNAVRSALSKPIFGRSPAEDVEESKSLFQRATEAIIGKPAEPKLKPVDPAVASAVRENLKNPARDAVSVRPIAETRGTVEVDPLTGAEKQRGYIQSMNAPNSKFYKVPELGHLKRPDGRIMSKEEEAMVHQSAVRSALSKPIFGRSHPDDDRGIIERVADKAADIRDSVVDKVHDLRSDARDARQDVERRIAGAETVDRRVAEHPNALHDAAASKAHVAAAEEKAPADAAVPHHEGFIASIKHMFSSADDAVEEAKDNAVAAKTAAVTTATNAKDAAVYNTIAAKNAALNKATDVKDAVVNKAVTAKDAVADKAAAAKDAVVNKAEQLRRDARDAADDAERRVANNAAAARDDAARKAHTAAEEGRRLAAHYADSPVAGLTRAAPDAAVPQENGFIASIRNIFSSAENAVEDAKDTVVDKTVSAKDAVVNKAVAAKDAVVDKAAEIRQDIRDEVREDTAAIRGAAIKHLLPHAYADAGRRMAARYSDSPIAGLTEAAPDPAVSNGFVASVKRVVSAAGDAVDEAKDAVADTAEVLRQDARDARATVERRIAGEPERRGFVDSLKAAFSVAGDAAEDAKEAVVNKAVSTKEALADKAESAKDTLADKTRELRRDARDSADSLERRLANDANALRDGAARKLHSAPDEGRRLAAHYSDSPVAGLTEAAPDAAIPRENGFIASIRNIFSSAENAAEDAKDAVVGKAEELRQDARQSRVEVERRIAGLRPNGEEGRRLAARYADSPVAGLTEASTDTAIDPATTINHAIAGAADAARDAATYAVSYAEAEPDADKKHASGRGPTASVELNPADVRRAKAAAAASESEREALFRQWHIEAERARGTSLQRQRDADVEMLVRRDWSVEENTDALQRAIAVATREQSVLRHALTSSRWSIAAESGIGLMSAYLLYNSAPVMSAWMPGSAQRRAGLRAMTQSVRSPLGVAVGALGIAFSAIFLPAELAHYRHNRTGLQHLTEVKEGFAARRHALLTKKGARYEEETH